MVEVAPTMPASVAWAAGAYGDASTSIRSPRLKSSYEGRFGSPEILLACKTAGACRDRSPSPLVTPRRGFTSFTDPMNPFDRLQSKKMVSVDAARADGSRAGARTRNPGIIPSVEPSSPSEDTSARFTVVHRFSTCEDFRPGKKGVREARGPPEGGSPGLAALASGGHGRMLANYLNDMKETTSSRRRVKDAGQPSDFLQKMNNRRVKLGADVQDEMRERAPPERRSEPSQAYPQSPREDPLLFARKRRSMQSSPVIPCAVTPSAAAMASPPASPVADDAQALTPRPAALEAHGSCCSSPAQGRMRSPAYRLPPAGAASAMRSQSLDFLRHREDLRASTSRREESLNRKQRFEQADQRAQELTAHMRAVSPRALMVQYRTRDQEGSGIF
eukprot:TRINITY_DN27841_c0_g1_i1.p1 TRINITY_DN27841_c0_g1~~TRINITY_DN27841_c0_g1_i1.p1  ORF type:complete len:389 (+),score=54.39 TRINITY_DN27841_c0_g1_i1:85-1251(+)